MALTMLNNDLPDIVNSMSFDRIDYKQQAIVTNSLVKAAINKYFLVKVMNLDFL